MTKQRQDNKARRACEPQSNTHQGGVLLDRLGRTLKVANLAVFCAAAGLASAKTVSEPVTLTQDTDWRGQGAVTLTGVGSINLAGFSLQTDGVTGDDDWREDVTTSDASKASSSAYFAGSASVLFDNDIRYATDHRFGANQYPCTIAYDFGEPVRLGAYKLYHQAVKDKRFPHTWTFEGSNDGTVWTVVDSHVNDRNWTNPCVRLFTFANATAFRHYRLNVPKSTDDGALELYQIECFKASPLDDRTDANASRVTSTSTFYGGARADMLFDNVFEHSQAHRAALYVTNNAPFEVTYDFGAPVCVNRYRLHYSSVVNNNTDRAPGTWTLAGSDDKETWTTVDTHTADGNWSSPDVRTFDCSKPGSYRYYRLEVTAPVNGDFMELSQIEYFSGPLITSSPSDGTSVTDLTTNDATRASASTLFAGTADVLFDNQLSYDRSHRICVNDFRSPAWFAYDFGEPTLVNGYTIYFNGVYAWRSPKAWTFEGSDDPAGNWNTLDRRDNITDWKQGEARSFAFANEKRYRYYRLKVVAPNSNGEERVLELYQLEFGAARGQLHVNVDSGVTQTNRSVVLSGALDLVKEGAGTWVAAMPQQRFLGDVRVAEGTLRAGLSGEEAVLGRPGFCTVTVGAKGVFDIDSFGGWRDYPVRLDGGTLACSMPAESAPTETFDSIALTADSSLSVRGLLTLGSTEGTGAIDLGGHRLTVDLVDGGLLNLSLAEIRNGKMAFTVDGAQAANGVKVASWTTAPTLTKARYVHARPAEDGLYVFVPGLLWVLR